MSAQDEAAQTKPQERASVLIKAKPAADLLPTFESLRDNAGVRMCDALIGDWDMLAVFEAADRATIDSSVEDSLKNIDQIDSYRVQHAGPDGQLVDLDALAARAGIQSAYVLAEIDPARADAVLANSDFSGSTICGGSGGDNVLAVLLLQAESIAGIKQSIDRLRLEPGLLRATMLQVVDLTPAGREGRAAAADEAAKIDAFGKMLWQRHAEPGILIPLLQAAQDSYGYVTRQAIEQIAEATGTGSAEIYGVVTFYKQFRLTPLGKHIVRVCQGTACHVMGADFIAQTVEEELGVIQDETTEDGLFTYMEVACLGCCSLAPVVMIDDQAYGRLTPQKLRTVLRRFRRAEKSSQAA